MFPASIPQQCFLSHSEQGTKHQDISASAYRLDLDSNQSLRDKTDFPAFWSLETL